MKAKKIKRFFIISTVIILLLAMLYFVLFSFPIKQEWTSEEEHIKLIYENVDPMSKHGDFKVFPVEVISKEEVDFRIFLVEYENGGCTFIMVTDTYLYKSIIGKAFQPARYLRRTMIEKEVHYMGSWSRYRVNLNSNEGIVYYEDSYWRAENHNGYTCFVECDSAGNAIYQYDSPYHIAGIDGSKEKLYCALTKDGYILPVCKNGDKLQSLITNELFFEEEIFSSNHAGLGAFAFPVKEPMYVD